MTPHFTSQLLEDDHRYVWRPFTQSKTAPPPIAISHAKGVELFDENGKAYLDMISSWWVNLHGHAHPALAEAIAHQARTLEQVIFATCTHKPAVDLAKRLAAALPGDLNRVFYSDNGSTAIEVGLKVAYQYWRNKGDTERTAFMAFEGGYHGDTFGSMSLGRSNGFFNVFDDLFFDVISVPYPHTWWGDPDVAVKEANALKTLESTLDVHGQRIAAMVLEPLVQGAAGMRMVRPEFLKKMVTMLQDAGIVVIFDEIMTGFGRTGDVFACETIDVTPDVICLSKGLTGGYLPLSTTVVKDSLYDAFYDDSFDKALVHGHSFAANPLGCAVALAALDLTLSEICDENRARINALHQERLLALGQAHDIAHARLQGTIAAFDIPVADGAGYTADVGNVLKRRFMEEGLLIRPLGNVVYLLPPYCTTNDQLHKAWDGIDKLLGEVL
jgi:adenosylmethionine-8-amino-7-oxononanoate aminotransferase